MHRTLFVMEAVQSAFAERRERVAISHDGWAGRWCRRRAQVRVQPARLWTARCGG